VTVVGYDKRGRTVIQHRTASTPPLATTRRGIAVKATRCTVSGCEKPTADRRTICSMHRYRMRRHGSFEIAHPCAPAPERFFAKVDQSGSGGCWLWTASADKEGYGRFNAGPGLPTMFAHRWSYEHHVGLIPVDLQLDHLCRNHRCCNPAHLEAVTGKENMLRGEAPGAIVARTNQCARGHDMTDSYIRPNGRRSCRECIKIHARNQKARQ